MPTRPKPLLAPDPLQDTTADVPWNQAYTGPRVTTRNTYSAPQVTVPVYVPGQGVVQMTQQERDDFLAADTEYRNSQLRYRDSRTSVADSQWDRTFGETQAARRDRMQQAKDALKEQRRQYDMSYGLNVREADLADRRFGGDLLKTGATLRGPADYFQGAAYANGVATSDLAPYVRSVYGGAGPQYGGGTATGGSPTPLTVGSLAREMGGGGGVAPGAGATAMAAPGTSGSTYLDTLGRTLTPEQQAYLAPIKDTLEGGIANKGLGYFEGMSRGQRAAFDSGAGFLGWDADEVDTRYKRSRPGNRDGRLA